MKIDKFGQQIYSEKDICEIFMKNSQISINRMITDVALSIPEELDLVNIPEFLTYRSEKCSLAEFDQNLQQQWFIPEHYKNLNIAEYVLSLCKTDEELQRAGEELLLFQQRDMFDLLRYLVYLVDTMRTHKIVWGVGRGSSVSSFVLFLIGVHKINSLYYGLTIDEFIK